MSQNTPEPIRLYGLVAALYVVAWQLTSAHIEDPEIDSLREAVVGISAAMMKEVRG